jgi:alpha-tubulin suppressor-like RCC1 family protein
LTQASLRVHAATVRIVLGCALVAACDNSSTTPTPTGSIVTYTSVSASSDRTCAVATSGVLYCWGRNGAGALGIDTTGVVPDSIGAVLAPTRVGRNIIFGSVSAGGDHTCGVATSGASYCWGAGTRGQIGAFHGLDRPIPTPVAANRAIITLSAGGSHSCGMNDAGVAFCWGWNLYGQLGNGSTIGLSEPEPVTVAFRFIQVSAGDTFTCGVNSFNAVYCWGLGTSGQLGQGTAVSSTTPIPVAGNISFSFVSVGRSHACGLTSAGIAYCWGDGSSGQLGNGTAFTSLVPVRVSGSLIFSTISAGAEHSCALTSAGDAYCWGTNNFGRLGVPGLVTSQPTPVQVATTMKFLQISAGSLHTCAISTDHFVYCWGFGGFGQLGGNSTGTHSDPEKTSAPADSATAR